MIIAKYASRFAHTTTVGKLIRIPLTLVPRNLNVPILSGINRGFRWVTGTGPNRGCWIGNYEADHLAALSRIIRPGMIVYDLGANAGYYTLALSRLVGPKGHVFAFEPDAGNVGALRRHIKLNCLKNATVAQVAVSSGSGIVPFEEDAGPSGSIAGAGGASKISGRYLVATVSLDEFIASDNPPPQFMKIDVEGAEGFVLAGAKWLLHEIRPSICLAVHTRALDKECRGILASNRYRLTQFDCESPAKQSGDFLAFPD